MTGDKCSRVGRFLFGRCVSGFAVTIAVTAFLLLVVFVGYAAALGVADRGAGVGAGSPGRGGMALPTLPPGHPGIGALPPGHPDIGGGGGGTLAPGHPDIDGGGALPPGHPGIGTSTDRPVYSL